MSDTATELNEFFLNLKIAQRAIPGPTIVSALQKWAGAQGYNAEIRIALGDLVRAVLNTSGEEIDLAARGKANPEHGFAGHMHDETCRVFGGPVATSVKREPVWITTFVSHRDCERCANAVESARLDAAVTGSIGATHTDDRRLVGDVEHTATVRRADKIEVNS